MQWQWTSPRGLVFGAPVCYWVWGFRWGSCEGCFGGLAVQVYHYQHANRKSDKLTAYQYAVRGDSYDQPTHLNLLMNSFLRGKKT